MNNPLWKGGALVGALYRVATKGDLMRVGNSWMKGRVRIGDLLLCVEHTGDGFFDYMLVNEYEYGLKAIPESRFGAYALGDRGPEISGREYHLLLDGRMVQISTSGTDDEHSHTWSSLGTRSYYGEEYSCPCGAYKAVDVDSCGEKTFMIEPRG